MLDHRVDITTPKVSVIQVADFVLGDIDPAMGVEIKYVEGLEGSNIMLLKRTDIKIIVDILMGAATPDEEFELNELTISAVCEVMNQMMGAASTAMSDFLGFPVNISTPEPFELHDLEEFKNNHMPHDNTVVVVRFALKIEDAVESEFMNIMSIDLAKELLSGLGLGEEEPVPVAVAAEPVSQEDMEPAPAAPAAPAASGGTEGKMSQEAIEAMLASQGGPAASGAGVPQEEIETMTSANQSPTAPPPAQPAAQSAAQQIPAQQPAAQPGPAQPAAAQAAPMPSMPYPMQGAPEGAAYGGYPYPPMYYPYPQPMGSMPDPKVINTQPVHMPEMDGRAALGKEQAENLDLIMEVPLQVTVEIGRTQQKVQDILEFSKGSLVVLDKLAGDQADLFVNGKCIARGDVVVVDDNFGVRITEIVQKDLVDAAVKR
jgi:flagellar motor switch protein FliN/FliY